MQKFGKYEVLEKVGVGGFGVVYKAFDPLIKRMVAVKTCTTDDAEIRRRFFQEAEIAGNLQHRNLVTVYDFGLQDEVPYLVQEFLTGEDLEEKIRRDAELPYADRISYLVQIARGLEFAHASGVIHRDIKPANIRILDDGAAKIMDFGIAKLAQSHTGLTQTGMTLGTAAYLAPEQIKGEKVDSRTDLFSFGVLAYELLTRLKAFDGETLSAVIYQILHKDPPPVSQVWTDAPPEANAIVARCLAKEINDRYPATRELVVDLERLLRRVRGEALAATGGREITASNLPTMAMPAGGDIGDLDATLPWRKAPKIDLPARPVSGASGAVAVSSAPAAPEPPAAAAPAKSGGGSIAKWAVAATVLLAAGVGAWFWLGRDASSGKPPAAAGAQPRQVDVSPPPGAAPVAPAPVPAPASTAKPDQPPGGPGERTEPISRQETPEARPSAGVQPAAEQPVAVQPTAVQPAAERPPAVAAPAPRPPGKATVVVAAGWDPRMSVSIDGQAPQPLDRPLRGEIAAGAHEFVFNLETPEFSDSQRVRLTLEPGKTHEIASPILAPGRLTVQAALSSPIGHVKVDGKDLGLSPVRTRLISAGTHSIEISDPRGAPSATAISQTIEVRAGFATTVTFDLAKGEMTTRERPAGGS